MAAEDIEWTIGSRPAELPPISNHRRHLFTIALVFSAIAHVVVAEVVRNASLSAVGEITEDVLTVELFAERPPATELLESSPPLPETAKITPPTPKREPVNLKEKKPLEIKTRLSEKLEPQTLARMDTPSSEAQTSSRSSGSERASMSGVVQEEYLTNYASALLSRLNSFKEYPRLARKRGIEGKVLVEIVINRTGQLRSSKLLHSSGSADLDESALTLIANAAPYPAAPQEIAGENLRFSLPIDYSLR